MSTQRNEYGEKFNSALAATLRGEQAARKIRTGDLSRISGVPIRTLNRYLHEERQIDVAVLAMIAPAFGMLPSRLMEMAQARMAEPTESHENEADSTQLVPSQPLARADITDGSEITQVDPALQVQWDEIDATVGLTKRQKQALKDHAQRDYHKP